MARTWKLTSALTALLIAGFSMASVNASTPPPTASPGVPEVQQSGDIVTITAPKGQKQATLNVWTADKLKAAKPMELSATATTQDASVADATSDSTGYKPGGLPAKGADETALKQFPRNSLPPFAPDQSQLQQAPTSANTLFTSYYVNAVDEAWLKYPQQAIGKLYFTDVYGNGYYCTASVISQYNVIVTAAHCLYNNNKKVKLWYSNWLFVPAESNSNAPYGTFSWVAARITTQWLKTDQAQYDIGIILLDTNIYDNSVTYYTGWLGVSWGLKATVNLFAFGYASNFSDL
jgi:V8-like Glu-specific endopeptidase